MGKQVKVKYVRESSSQVGALCMFDMTLGEIYDAYLPDKDEVDESGYGVMYDDEVWLQDDINGQVVVQLSDGLEIVTEA